MSCFIAIDGVIYTTVDDTWDTELSQFEVVNLLNKQSDEIKDLKQQIKKMQKYHKNDKEWVGILKEVMAEKHRAVSRLEKELAECQWRHTVLKKWYTRKGGFRGIESAYLRELDKESKR